MRIKNLVYVLILLFVSCAGVPVPGIFNTPPAFICSQNSKILEDKQLELISVNEDYSSCKKISSFSCGSFEKIDEDEIKKMKSFAYIKKANGLNYKIRETTAQKDFTSKIQKYWMAEGYVYGCTNE